MRQLVKMSASLVSIRHADNYGKKREKKRGGVWERYLVSPFTRTVTLLILFSFFKQHTPLVSPRQHRVKKGKKNEHYVCF